jgi:pilus assembly protein CpaB
MKLRTIIFAVLALIAGLGTATFARHQLSQARQTIVQQAAERPSTTIYVLVAARDLPSGYLVQPDDLVWQSWPDDRVSDAYLRKDRDDPQALAGAVVRLHISQGEPVSAGRMVKPGERGFLAAVLAPGMRATSVPLTATSDVAGLILPGDHVDLILSHQIPDMRDPNAPARTVGETVVTNLRVVAIDQTVNDQDKKPLSGKTATFEVTPRQAEMIEVAKLIGNLSLDLRSAGEAPDSKAADNKVADNKVADGKDAKDAGADGKGAATPEDETTHTWDSDVSPLLRRPDHGSGGVASVTILRGAGKGGDSSGGAPGAAIGGLGPAAGSINNASNGAKGIADAAMSLRNTAGAGLIGGF